MAFSNLVEAGITFGGDLGDDPIGFEDTNFFDPNINIDSGTGLGGFVPEIPGTDLISGTAGTVTSPTSSDSDSGGTTTSSGGVDITTTDSGDILGLEDLKNTQGYIDYESENSGATGQDYLDYLNSGGEQDQLQGEVDSVFASGEGLLDSAEANLRASEGDLQTSATAPYDAATATATANIAEGTAAFGAGIAEAGQSEQTLLASARRLYDELQRRNRQQFGGTELTSAAQGASELGARALQQGLGNIQTTTQNAISTLKRNLIDFENGAAAKLQELAFMKDKAIADANIAFRDALQAIDAQRAQLSANKAIAKLDALRAYRDQLFDVQAQATAFRQQIELMREQARLNVSTNLAAIGAASNRATSSSQDILDAQSASGAGVAAAQSAGSRIGSNQSSSVPQISGRVGEEDPNIGGSLLSL